MTLRIRLRVKFRALGITFGTLSLDRAGIPLPVTGIITAPVQLIHIDERGILLDIYIDP